jgi:hypothetical protein
MACPARPGELFLPRAFILKQQVTGKETPGPKPGR